tara:strand:+ start:58596 stop:59096 length:501 start_codon:yes stop_codon:yes gene_type:complete
MSRFVASLPHSDEHGSILIYRHFFDLYFYHNELQCDEIASGFDCATSYFHRIKKGKRPFRFSYVNKLIKHFEIDHARLYWSVEHFEDPQKYFEPEFKNIVHFLSCFVENYEELDQAGEIDGFKAMLSIIQPRSCEKLAREQFSDIRTKFRRAEAALASVPQSLAQR